MTSARWLALAFGAALLFLAMCAVAIAAGAKSRREFLVGMAVGMMTTALGSLALVLAALR